MADEITKPSSIINRTEAKKRLIRAAQADRYYFLQFEPRVSGKTLDDLEAYAESWIRNHVSKLPSKGKTI
jgi:hypothetical protein